MSQINALGDQLRWNRQRFPGPIESQIGTATFLFRKCDCLCDEVVEIESIEVVLFQIIRLPGRHPDIPTDFSEM
jgi:hypothetical protein